MHQTDLSSTKIVTTVFSIINHDNIFINTLICGVLQLLIECELHDLFLEIKPVSRLD